MTRFLFNKHRWLVFISLGFSSLFLAVILSYAAGLHENSIQARIKDNQLHLTLGISSDFAEGTNARINFIVTDIDGNIVATSSQTIELRQGHGNQYSFVIPAKIDS